MRYGPILSHGPLRTAIASFRSRSPQLALLFGDIGTSMPTHENVLGVLSLIIYSLLLVISIRNVAIVMRADNQGEGGVLALDGADSRAGPAAAARRLAVGRPILIALGIFGTALLYGDGMITPAISVLGAIEGLEVATPLFQPTSCRSPSRSSVGCS